MDLQLPGTDGLALTRQIKADPALRGLPVVALSAGEPGVAGPAARGSGLLRVHLQADPAGSLSRRGGLIFRAGPGGSPEQQGRCRMSALERGQSADILVVDDEPRNIRLLEGYLRAEGYDVRTATSGRARAGTGPGAGARRGAARRDDAPVSPVTRFAARSRPIAGCG